MTPRHASRGSHPRRHGTGAAAQHQSPPARPTPGAGRHSGTSWLVRPAPPGRPRVAADPVQVLIERHQDLYADAVDPLDIAVVLERSGVGPQTAGRFRHADVFSLAEELHARVPRRAAAPPPEPGVWRRRARPALVTGLALSVVALLLWGLRVLGLPAPLGAQAAAFAAASAPTLGRGLRLPERALLAVGVGGLLALSQRAGPPQLALAAGVGVADWCARWYRHLGWGHVRSRSSREFRSRMRPVLPAVALTYTAVLAGITAAALALPEGGTHLARTAPGAVWAVQLGAGAALLATLLLRHAERTPSALAALAAACGCVALVRSAPPHPTLAAWVCAPAAALLLPYVWVCLLSPAAHRPPGEHDGAAEEQSSSGGPARRGPSGHHRAVQHHGRSPHHGPVGHEPLLDLPTDHEF